MPPAAASVRPMRWEELFRDLEGQLEAAERSALVAEVAGLTRAEEARTDLLRRLVPAVGHPVALHVHGLGALNGRLVAVAAQWLLVQEAPSRQVLVPRHSLLAVAGLATATAPAADGGPARVHERLGLGHALRGLARDRAGVTVVLVDGTALHGTFDRVGADYAELAEHQVGEARRRGSVRLVRSLPFSAMGAVRGG